MQLWLSVEAEFEVQVIGITTFIFVFCVFLMSCFLVVASFQHSEKTKIGFWTTLITFRVYFFFFPTQICFEFIMKSGYQVSGGGYTSTALLSHYFREDFTDIHKSVEELEEQMRKNIGIYVDRSNWLRGTVDVLYIVLISLFLFLFGNLHAVLLAVFPLGLALNYLLVSLGYSSIFASNITEDMKIFLTTTGFVSTGIIFTSKMLLLHFSTSTNWKIYIGVMAVRAFGVLLALLNAIVLTTFLSSLYYNYFVPTLWMTVIICLNISFFFALTRLMPTNFFFLAIPIIGSFLIGFSWLLYFQLFDASENPFDGRAQVFIIWTILFIVVQIVQSFGSTSIIHWVTLDFKHFDNLLF